MARSNEPIIWSLFAAGGAIAAMLVPVHIILLGLAIPLGWVEPVAYEKLLDLVTHPIGRLYLFVLISIPFFHAAHRILFTLIDLGLKGLRGPLSALCYGGAVAGTVWCGWVVWTL